MRKTRSRSYLSLFVHYRKHFCISRNHIPCNHGHLIHPSIKQAVKGYQSTDDFPTETALAVTCPYTMFSSMISIALLLFHLGSAVPVNNTDIVTADGLSNDLLQTPTNPVTNIDNRLNDTNTTMGDDQLSTGRHVQTQVYVHAFEKPFTPTERAGIMKGIEWMMLQVRQDPHGPQATFLSKVKSIRDSMGHFGINLIFKYWHDTHSRALAQMTNAEALSALYKLYDFCRAEAVLKPVVFNVEEYGPDWKQWIGFGTIERIRPSASGDAGVTDS